MIRAEDVSVYFRQGIRRRRLKALDHLDLEIRDGDFFALLGENGAGKSTAMYCLLGLLRPTTGRVTISGRVPTLGSDLFRSVAYLPEEPHYHDYLTVEEAVRYYGSLYGERMGTPKVHARVMFLDEPMRGLDPLAVKEFRDVLVEKNRAGVTIVMNSHLLAEVEMVATRAAILAPGRVVVQDTLSNLRVVDTTAYAVDVQDHPDLPVFFVRESSLEGRAQGTVPVEHLYELLDFTRANNLAITSVSQHKSSLEDSFFSILARKPPDA